MRGHDHTLDGKLHDDCTECDRIRGLRPDTIPKGRPAGVPVFSKQIVVDWAKEFRDG